MKLLDLAAIRARCDAATPGPWTCDDGDFVAHARTDIPALLAYIDELEGRVTYTVGETEWAMRIANAEQRYVDEYDAHQETRTLLTDLYRTQLRADAAQMREYGISYHGLRKLFAEYDGGELSLGRVLELLRAAARELAKQEHDDERL
jgi:hypothetical protein